MIKREVLNNLAKEFAASEQAKAICAVKKHFLGADDYWIDIKKAVPDKYSENDFIFIVFELFKKRVIPSYPPREPGESIRDHYLFCRAITWDTAKRDIENQKARGYNGHIWRMVKDKTVRADKNIHYFFLRGHSPNFMK